jgi:hypothetical protein
MILCTVEPLFMREILTRPEKRLAGTWQTFGLENKKQSSDIINENICLPFNVTYSIPRAPDTSLFSRVFVYDEISLLILYMIQPQSYQ